MRIAVMAAGAVGGYFGARLVQAGHEVAFVESSVIPAHSRGWCSPSTTARCRRAYGSSVMPAVERGTRLGVATPCNRAISDILSIYSGGSHDI
jgi:Ketopantoate reductase PanE/ApbA